MTHLAAMQQHAAVGRLGAVSIRVCELICKHLFADVAAASLLILAWSVVTTAIASRQ
jgi:hypothetical protein